MLSITNLTDLFSVMKEKIIPSPSDCSVPLCLVVGVIYVQYSTVIQEFYNLSLLNY